MQLEVTLHFYYRYFKVLGTKYAMYIENGLSVCEGLIGLIQSGFNSKLRGQDALVFGCSRMWYYAFR